MPNRSRKSYRVASPSSMSTPTENSTPIVPGPDEEAKEPKQNPLDAAAVPVINPAAVI